MQRHFERGRRSLEPARISGALAPFDDDGVKTFEAGEIGDDVQLGKIDDSPASAEWRIIRPCR